jgi:hypothetical protein
METLLAGEPFDDIQVEHLSIKESSISEFDSKKKMGGKTFSEEYLKKVRSLIYEKIV